MRASFTRVLTASLASLALGLALAGPVSPAFARGGGGGGAFHGGGGGGGFHGGGFRGGGFHGGGYGGGFYGGDGFYDGDGLLPYQSYYPKCVTYQPRYDRYGHYLGQRAVNVC